MKKEDARSKLENKGYKVVALMQGGYIAKKGSRLYKAETLNGLIKIIFGGRR